MGHQALKLESNRR